jgi:hypothetical protein
MNLKPLDEYVAYNQTQQAQSDVDAGSSLSDMGLRRRSTADDYKSLDCAGNPADAGEQRPR